MKLRKKLRQIISELWVPAFGGILALLALLAVYIYGIKRMLPGFSVSEKATIASAKSASLILQNPLYAPHKIMQYILIKFDHSGFIAMRGVSVIIGMGIVSLFFYTVRRWFSLRVAVISTILFATSSWMLHITRLATSDIMMLSIMAAIAYGAWLPRTKKHRLAVALGFALVIWLLYIPGLFWFVVIGAIWQRKTIIKLLKSERAVFIVIVIGLLALLGPLFYALFNDQMLARTYLGLSISPLTMLAGIPKRLLMIPVKLSFYNSPVNPVYNIGTLPLLDIFAVGMAILGAYNFYINDRLLDRTKILLGGIIVSCGLYALNGPVGIQILLPFVYLLIAGGIAFMLQQWFKVFPTNPFAKTIAIVLLVLSVVTVSYYNVNSYFIAWPSMPATRAVFNQKP